MAQMIYNSVRHSYIGERVEVEEEVLRDAYASILADLPALRDIEARESNAWQIVTDEDLWTEDMEGVKALGEPAVEA
jgi:hypothetical protein